MSRLHFLHLLAAATLSVPLACAAQAAAPACADFVGDWTGTWSQGFYGRQRIVVPQVSEQCVATLAYSPTEAMPTVWHQMPIRDGVIDFACNGPAGRCRIEARGETLHFTFTDPSGFVNVGTFRKKP
jgi:hypothetical protein